jgi:hypothetical protein
LRMAIGTPWCRYCSSPPTIFMDGGEIVRRAAFCLHIGVHSHVHSAEAGWDALFERTSCTMHLPATAG